MSASVNFIPVRRDGGGSVPITIAKQLLARHGLKKLKVQLGAELTPQQFQQLKAGLRPVRSEWLKKKEPVKGKRSSEIEELLAKIDEPRNVRISHFISADEGGKTTLETKIAFWYLKEESGGRAGGSTQMVPTTASLTSDYNGWKIAIKAGTYYFNLAAIESDPESLAVQAVGFFAGGKPYTVYGYKADRTLYNARNVIRSAATLNEFVHDSLMTRELGSTQHLAYPVPWLWVWNESARVDNGEITELGFIGYRYEPGETGQNRGKEQSQLYLSASQETGKELLITGT